MTEPLQIGVQCDTTEETKRRIAEWRAAQAKADERRAQLGARDPKPGSEELLVYRALGDRIRFYQECIEGAEDYVEMAELIDAGGPYCTVEAHVGGITINFQTVKVEIAGSVNVKKRRSS